MASHSEYLVNNSALKKKEFYFNETCDASTQVDFNVTCDAGTQVDFNVTCDNSTETSEGNERKKITNGGAVEEEKGEPRRKIAEMEPFIEEKDRRQIRNLQVTIHKMKVQRRNEIEFIKTMEEMDISLIRRLRGIREQITHLQERRPQLTEKT